MRPVRGAFLATALTVAVLAATSASAGAAAAPPPKVTFFGDSIAAALAYDAIPTHILGRNVDLDLQLAVCRRLVGTSCPHDGATPPTLVDLLPTIQVAPNVIVEVGYNDFESLFPDTVETVLAALRHAGARRIFWLTYRENRGQYVSMNDVLFAAAAKHPELTVVDWNKYSRSHPDWFQQEDGLHLDYAGEVAMATLVQKALKDSGVIHAAPLAIATKKLPAARVGRRYRVQLRTDGGSRPVTWARLAGALPSGLTLSAAGVLTGTPLKPGWASATLKVTDGSGRTVTQRFAVVVRPR